MKSAQAVLQYVSAARPAVGLRAWKLRDGQLVSWWRETPWPIPFAEAACPYQARKHVAPSPDCTCGIYVQPRLPPVAVRMGTPDAIWGAVKLWGRVIREAYETRGQYAEIDCLIVDSECAEKFPDITALSSALGVRLVSSHVLYRLTARAI